MPLSPAEQRIWEESCLELEASLPPMLPVDEVIGDVADFWAAIEDAKARGQIDDKTFELANDFFGEVYKKDDLKAAIGDLEYFESFEGLNLILGFGSQGDE